MNDDVSGIYKSGDKKRIELNKEEFNELINKMFDELEYNGYTFSALYPCDSVMYMNKSKEITYDLCLCMDPFSAIINNKEVKLTEFPVIDKDGSIFISDKSDWEKSILHYKSKGGLVRFNRYCIKVKYFIGEGGYQGRNEITEKQTGDLFLKKYPEYVSGYKVKKGGYISLNLKRLKRKN